MADRIPGIIVRIVNDAGIIAPPVFERYPVIIGEGDPYRQIDNRLHVRSAGVVDSIIASTTVNEIVSVGDLPGIANYTSGTDYNLSSGNRISWVPGGTSPTIGNNYYITFTETRAATAYSPTLYFDENLIYADHGNSTRTNGNINDVSVGGSLALNAGSQGVIIAQLDLRTATDPDSPTNTELENAFIVTRNALNTITDYKLFLVPMSSGTLNTTTAATIFFNHAVLASQPENKQERTVIMAMPQNTTYLQFANTAQAFDHERMVVPAAVDGITQVVGITGNNDMRFYNAALAGRLCSVPIGINISDDIIPNVLVTDNYTPAELEFLVRRGVSPSKVRGTVVRNVLAITTDTTNALVEDLGVQDVKDYVKKFWREGLFDVYRNRPINSRLVAQIQSSSENILEFLTSQEIVADWRNISVAQDVTEPRQINITGQVQPAFGLQWMDVTFTFVLSFS
jgi:hypothetical protein